MTDYYIPYFTHKELACPQTGKIILAPGFADKLIELREAFGKPMSVNSACRSKEYNKKIKGAAKSFHVFDQPFYQAQGCCAVDIAMTCSATRGKLIAAAWHLGWSIGVHKNFIHLDRRIDYTNLEQIVFTY